jgi:hypothetical protein
VIEDRHLRVPAGAIVETGYAPIEKIKMACRDRMAVGDIEGAYRKRLQLGSDQSWPPPYGEWDGDTFILIDGRHEFIASLMIGLDHLFVAWIKPQSI